MHRYLRAIGFSKVKDKPHLLALLKLTIQNPDRKEFVSQEETEYLFAEYTKGFGPNIGLIVRGELDDHDEFLYDYFVPYIAPQDISSVAPISIKRMAEKEAYAGVCDDNRVGISLIFYLLNVIDYKKRVLEKSDKRESLFLSGLSVEGTIVLPVFIDSKEKVQMNKEEHTLSKLMDAAQKGDMDAKEDLTLKEFEIYEKISKRMKTEDIYTLVETYIIPYGVECDQYSILGEIVSCEEIRNSLTGEELYCLMLNCNHIPMTVCINKEDLVGEPAAGRRFKGTVWLQGIVVS